MKKFKHCAWDLTIIISAVYEVWDRQDKDTADLLLRMVNLKDEKHRKYKIILSEEERFIIFNALNEFRNKSIGENDPVAIRETTVLLMKYAA